MSANVRVVVNIRATDHDDDVMSSNQHLFNGVVAADFGLVAGLVLNVPAPPPNELVLRW